MGSGWTLIAGIFDLRRSAKRLALLALGYGVFSGLRGLLMPLGRGARGFGAKVGSAFSGWVTGKCEQWGCSESSGVVHMQWKCICFSGGNSGFGLVQRETGKDNYSSSFCLGGGQMQILTCTLVW